MNDIDKVNEFEHGIGNGSEINKDHLSFSVASNIHYRYSSAKELLAKPEDLASMIKHHKEYQVPRLSVLDDYYKAKNTSIIQNRRRKELNKADHRAAHNFGKVLTQFDVGYNTGNPIKVEVKDNDSQQQTIDNFNTINDIDEINSELWTDVDKYGRAYEIQVRSQDDEDRIFLSNVFETFVVYDTTIERKPILAVRYFRSGFDNDEVEFNTIAYSEDKIIEYQKTSFNAIVLKVEKETDHSYKEIQITEHSSNRFRQGLYEDILPLIDLYDSAQSDSANYMTDLNDALLVISGDVEAAGITTEDAIKQKDANMLILESGTDFNGNKTSVSAEYIYKQYDVSGSEAYKQRVRKDLHAIASVPDLTDENFSGTQSGEAMKYKLFGFEQMTATKQRMFKKGLMKRYRLLFNLKSGIQELDNADLSNIRIMFTPNLPKAISAELEMLIKAGTEFSQETLLNLASFVDSAKLEQERVKAEQPKEELYDFQTTATETTNQIVGE